MSEEIPIEGPSLVPVAPPPVYPNAGTILTTVYGNKVTYRAPVEGVPDSVFVETEDGFRTHVLLGDLKRDEGYAKVFGLDTMPQAVIVTTP